jgi:hypothetical protein
MIRLPDGTDAKNKNQWHSSHSKIKNTELEAKRNEALAQKVSLEIRPTSIIYYGNTEFTVAPGILYVPKSCNQVALDSFIFYDGLLYMFQFTIAAKHPIKPKLLPSLAKFSEIPPMDNWVFIFVIPDNNNILKCPWTEELQQLKVFSAILEVKGEKK